MTKFLHLARRNCLMMLLRWLGSACFSPAPSASSSHISSHIWNECFERPSEVQWEIQFPSTKYLCEVVARREAEAALWHSGYFSSTFLTLLDSLSLFCIFASAAAALWACELTCSCPVFPAPLIEEGVFSPLYTLASFIKDKVTICAWVYLWAFYPVPLIYISVFVPVPYCLDYYSFVV